MIVIHYSERSVEFFIFLPFFKFPELLESQAIATFGGCRECHPAGLTGGLVTNAQMFVTRMVMRQNQSETEAWGRHQKLGQEALSRCHGHAGRFVTGVSPVASEIIYNCELVAPFLLPSRPSSQPLISPPYLTTSQLVCLHFFSLLFLFIHYLQLVSVFNLRLLSFSLPAPVHFSYSIQDAFLQLPHHPCRRRPGRSHRQASGLLHYQLRRPVHQRW